MSETERLIALDLLAELSAQIAAGRGDVTALGRVGFTAETAKELADLINASRGGR